MQWWGTAREKEVFLCEFPRPLKNTTRSRGSGARCDEGCCLRSWPLFEVRSKRKQVAAVTRVLQLMNATMSILVVIHVAAQH